MVGVVVGLVVGATGCGGSPRELGGLVRRPAPDVGSVVLDDARSGEPVATVASDDHVLLVYFGYTNCPDVCPTTLSDIRRALSTLDEADAERVDLAMITIDPDRDTPDLLAGYVASFVPDAQALSTTDDTVLRAAADQFGASYAVARAADGTIEVAHSASLYAVDDLGRLVVQWTFGTPPDDVAADLEFLLSGVLA
jgi:protein SCO1/2